MAICYLSSSVHGEVKDVFFQCIFLTLSTIHRIWSGHAQWSNVLTSTVDYIQVKYILFCLFPLFSYIFILINSCYTLTCNLYDAFRHSSKTHVGQAHLPQITSFRVISLPRAADYLLCFFRLHTFSFSHKSSIALRQSAFPCIHEDSPTITNSLASFAAVVGLISTAHRTQLRIDNRREYPRSFLVWQQLDCLLQYKLDIELLLSQLDIQP